MNQEEKERHGELMAEVLGIPKREDSGASAQARDEQGRYVPADAGEKGLPQKHEKDLADVILDAIYGGDHSGGVSWTKGN